MNIIQILIIFIPAIVILFYIVTCEPANPTSVRFGLGLLSIILVIVLVAYAVSVTVQLNKIQTNERKNIDSTNN